jgi:hypothetical protein
MPADRAGCSPPPDPLADLIRRAIATTDDPDLRAWLVAMARGERAAATDPANQPETQPT